MYNKRKGTKKEQILIILNEYGKLKCADIAKISSDKGIKNSSYKNIERVLYTLKSEGFIYNERPYWYISKNCKNLLDNEIFADQINKSSDDIGYVYIFTNPSFKENCVKIGMTIDVERRRKELFTTGVPTEFEIYATMKTSKYSEVEKVVHQTIDSLTDLRIRQNREFFNITPQEALKIFDVIKGILDDAEIKVY